MNEKLHVVLDSVVVVSAFLTTGLAAELVFQCQAKFVGVQRQFS